MHVLLSLPSRGADEFRAVPVVSLWWKMNQRAVLQVKLLFLNDLNKWRSSWSRFPRVTMALMALLPKRLVLVREPVLVVQPARVSLILVMGKWFVLVQRCTHVTIVRN